jgi:PAS domain S-box-containing protein
VNSEEKRPPASLLREECIGLVEEAPVGVCVVQDGCIVYGNRWLREFSGYAADGDFPLEFVTVVHPDDRDLVTRRMHARLSGADASSSCTVRFVKRDGAVREVELYDKKTDFLGRPAIQAALTDVTARIDAERNLQEHTARLEESNHFRQLFSDILSHDLMNPVWIAENYLRLVMDGGVPDDKRAFFDAMRGSLAKARGILADARTYLKLQDLTVPGGENVDLGPIVEAVAKSLRPLGDEKGQTLTVSGAGSAMISASPLVKEVVSQLISNALKFAPPDSAIEVSLSAGRRVRLEVRDRGPGVPEECRERIFKRFEGMEKGPITGVGLGLAIVWRIVDLYGGRVWTEANPEGGSIFVVEFPAAD